MQTIAGNTMQIQLLVVLMLEISLVKPDASAAPYMWAIADISEFSPVAAICVVVSRRR